MERSTIYYLHQKGWTKTEIAEFLGHHRDTVAKVLREPVDQQPAPRQRTSAVAVFAPQIATWLDQQWTVQRMLEEARQHPDHPYTSSAAAFYDDVRPLKRARKGSPGQIPVRFDGLPGELLQIDWGEVRQFAFTRPSLAGQTRYFFAARLKHSRWMWVRFTSEMREETLLRCLIAVFVALGGVPWVVTTDNMKTVTIGRDAAHQPIWHPAFAKCAAEFGFHPDACALAAGNQKGAVESLVKFVKQNFLLGRSFQDDALQQGPDCGGVCGAADQGVRRGGEVVGRGENARQVGRALGEGTVVSATLAAGGPEEGGAVGGGDGEQVGEALGELGGWAALIGLELAHRGWRTADQVGQPALGKVAGEALPAQPVAEGVGRAHGRYIAYGSELDSCSWSV